MSMSTGIVEQEIRTISILKEIEIAAPLDIAFEAVLEELGPGGEMPGGKPFPMVIEPWPGGRWYRDLGNHSGHFWGVQPAWLQLSRDRKPLKWREKAHVLGVEPRPVACSRGHYSPVGLKGDAQGTYPDR
jgi:hypothetical protein